MALLRFWRSISVFIYISTIRPAQIYLLRFLQRLSDFGLPVLFLMFLRKNLYSQKEKIPRHELGKMYRNSKGILHSSQMTIFVLILSMLGVIPIKSTMLTTIILGSFQFVVYILLTSIYQGHSFWGNVIVISIQFALLDIILLLKILH